MSISDNTLLKYQAQLRKIEEHREKNAEKNIERIYRAIMKDLQFFVAEYYADYANYDILNYEILYSKNVYGRFLEEVVNHINDFEPELYKELVSLIDNTYEACYTGMIEAVEKSKNIITLKKEFESLKQVRPEVLKAAVENPVTGLTLFDRLEKHRADIIYNIKQEIGIGLQNGDRYSTMARRISEKCDFSYGKSIVVARTESRRVREKGYNDSAIVIDEVIKRGNSGLIGIKIWRTMDDEKVRPQRVYKTKKGYKKGKIKSNAPNHVKMNGKVVLISEKFNLGQGVMTVAPLQSGVAGHDINCRCYAERQWITEDEYKKIAENNFYYI